MGIIILFKKKTIREYCVLKVLDWNYIEFVI